MIIMKPEERFTKTFFGVIMIACTFVTWGKWVTGVLGILFLLSAFMGVCWACEISKRFLKEGTQ